MYSQKKVVLTRVIYVGIIAIISAVLTIPSMYVIKNVPGNNFSTEMDFIATALLVFGLWFLGVMSVARLIKFLINLGKLKKKPSGIDAQRLVEKRNRDIKRSVTLRKVFIGILNVACIYLSIVFSMTACVFLGLGTPFVIWIVFVSANVCVILLVLGCSIADFTMMMKLRHNPYNQKAINTREKVKTFFKILVLLYIFIYSLMFIYLSLSSH